MWDEKRLKEIAVFNPRETLKKGAVAKRIAMEQLQPFCRDVSAFDFAAFNGGTKFRNGDTIMARITPCLENGKMAKINVLDEDEVGFGSTEYIVLRAREEIDEDFLYYLIYSSYVREAAIKSMVGSSGRQRVQTSVLENLLIRVPPYREQQKIGRTLKDIDDKIASNRAINKNLEEQLTALYEDLISSSRCIMSTVGDIAEKIAMGPFGSNIKVSTFVNQGIPIISGNHLRGLFLEEHSFNYITEAHAEKLGNSIVYPNDIIFTHAGNIGTVAMIPPDCNYEYYIISQRQFYLRCDENKVVPEYVLLYFHSRKGQQKLLSYANQTAVPSIAQPATNLKKITIPLPTYTTQKKWQRTTEPLVSLYLKNRCENMRLCSIRDTLLPRLMSGELDVSNIEL
jgi:type I restriction enzyme S subunit